MENEQAKAHFSSKKNKNYFSNLLNSLLKVYGSVEEILADFKEVKENILFEESENFSWEENVQKIEEFKSVYDSATISYRSTQELIKNIEKTLEFRVVSHPDIFLDYIDSITLEEIEQSKTRIEDITNLFERTADKIDMHEDRFAALFPNEMPLLQQQKDEILFELRNVDASYIQETTKFFRRIYGELVDSSTVKVNNLLNTINENTTIQEVEIIKNKISKIVKSTDLAGAYYLACLQTNIAVKNEEVRKNIIASQLEFTDFKKSIDSKLFTSARLIEQIQSAKNNNQPQEVNNEAVISDSVLEQNNTTLEPTYSPIVEENNVSTEMDILSNITSAETPSIDIQEPVYTSPVKPPMPEYKPVQTESNPAIEEYMSLLQGLNDCNKKINEIIIEEDALLINSPEVYIKNINSLEQRAEPLHKLQNEIKSQMNKLEYETFMKTGRLLGNLPQMKIIGIETIKQDNDFEAFVGLHNEIIGQCHNRIKEINTLLKQENVDKKSLENELLELVKTVANEKTIISRRAVIEKSKNPSFDLIKFAQSQREAIKTTKKDEVSFEQKEEVVQSNDSTIVEYTEQDVDLTEETVTQQESQSPLTSEPEYIQTTFMPELEQIQANIPGYESETKVVIKLGKLNFGNKVQGVSVEDCKISESNKFTIKIIKQGIKVEYKKQLVEQLRQLQAKIELTIKKNGQVIHANNEIIDEKGTNVYQIISNPQDLEEAQIAIKDADGNVIKSFDLMEREEFKDKVDEIKSSFHR